MDRTRLVVLSAVIAAVSAPLPAGAATLGPPTRLVSISSDGVQGNSSNGLSIADITPQGRYVAFDAISDNLVSGDTNGVPDAFLRDLLTGTTTRVSVSSDGREGDASSGDPSVSDDGRYVAFVSDATNLVPFDTNGATDVFVRDLVAGTTERVSVSSFGEQGNADSGGSFSPPAISADGRYVAFTSDASNINNVFLDTNDASDVYERDRLVGVTSMISVSPITEESGNGPSILQHPDAVSADGQSVAFTSLASDLVDGDTNGVGDVFVRDLAAVETIRVSVSTQGDQANGESLWGVISHGGRYVAFSSAASNLAVHDANGTSDVFLRDLRLGTTALVSLSSSNEQGNDSSCCTKGVSDDGRLVAFTSLASNLIPGDGNAILDVFLRDTEGGVTTGVSVTRTGQTGNDASGNATISADGRWVVFVSLATNLVRRDDNGSLGDVFVRRVG